MRHRISLALVILLAAVVPSAAQNLCAAPPSPLVLVTATSDVVAEFSDYSAALGTAVAWSDVAVGIFARGAAPASAVPVAAVSVPKASWTLVAGTATCYRTRPTILFGVAANTQYDLYVRTTRVTPDAAASTWSGPAPFGRLGPPAAPTNLRVIP